MPATLASTGASGWNDTSSACFTDRHFGFQCGEICLFFPRWEHDFEAARTLPRAGYQARTCAVLPTPAHLLHLIQ